MKYFRLLDDLDIQDRWFIGEIDVEKFSDIWQYTQAKKISLFSSSQQRLQHGTLRELVSQQRLL